MPRSFYFLATFTWLIMKEVAAVKGWYEGYSYVGIMPNGRKQRFVSDSEYREAYAEEAGLSYIF